MTRFMVTDEGRRLSSSEFARQWPIRHDNLLRKVRQILETAPEIGRLNFEESNYLNSQGKRQPEYLMTADGFHLLCMEVGGLKSLKTKWAWIQATKQILEEQAALQDELQSRRHQVEDLQAQLKHMSRWAKRLASSAGRTLAEWRRNPSRKHLLLEAEGQQRLYLDVPGDAPGALPCPPDEVEVTQ